MFRFLVVVAVIIMLVSFADAHRMVKADEYTLESVRESLIRQEDTIIFSLIERARFPLNSPTYERNYSSIPNFSGSLFDFILHQTEDIQAKTGRYMNPEENPYEEKLSPSIVSHYNFSQFLYPAAASININKKIRKVYFNNILPLFIAFGNDGNYAQTAANDLSILQDRKALMNLLVDKRVEEIVLKRVEKKAMVFGEEVSIDSKIKGKYKVDPSIVYNLYNKWIIPMTKDIEVEYILRRLD
ncbi:chorismate mutase 2 isoform X2 [Lathyrus oleraceus]|uniref:chorismate mutase 2 isoform X2 n=1 Tax=Pisum sativum TaxID=3888 RepID=UPI0021CEBA9C|nr:chorismate mutase 2-like isoform X2 [Pisum sativum]